MTTGGYDAGYEAGIDSLIHDIYDLQDENAKLRELARTLWGWLLMPTVGPATLHDLQGQLKELGIEVDG